MSACAGSFDRADRRSCACGLYAIGLCCTRRYRGWIVPLGHQQSRVVRTAALSTAAMAVLLTASALAADPDAFLAGTTKACIECDLSGHDLTTRDVKRAKLD